RVVVIDGGNVAIDAERTAMRLGASEDHGVYRRTRGEMAGGEEGGGLGGGGGGGGGGGADGGGGGGVGGDGQKKSLAAHPG
ncbi:hypothetical protein HKBW3C_02692, partial [Candidatus Hakubella thermalkaliphila]